MGRVELTLLFIINYSFGVVLVVTTVVLLTSSYFILTSSSSSIWAGGYVVVLLPRSAGGRMGSSFYIEFYTTMRGARDRMRSHFCRDRRTEVVWGVGVCWGASGEKSDPLLVAVCSVQCTVYSAWPCSYSLMN